jgi:hypothetical protein
VREDSFPMFSCRATSTGDSMIFSRKLILVAGAALLAACGDKITIPAAVNPPPATTKINSVDVAPATATITAGASIPFTAAVNADAGVVYTTAWTSSVSTVVVGATTGVVTTTAASVTPGATICATVTAGTQIVKACGTLVVTAPPTGPTTNPATVSIQSITAGGTFFPVNQANVAGQIDVTLNVNPGNQVISKVETLVGGVVACTQTFTAAQAAALRFASDEAVAAQTTFPQIVCSVNTAAFNATTGIPTWLNGAQTVQAKVYTTTSGIGTAATASAVQTLTFNNANTYVLNSSASGTPAISAANGYKYSTGSLATTVIPVIYTSAGLQMASGTITFGAAGCDATGPRSLALTVASGQGTVTFTKATGTASATNFKSYELRTALCGSLNTGEGFTLTAMDNAGNQLFAAAAPANDMANRYRMDNVAPAAPVVLANPNGRANGWLNDAAAFTVITAAGNDGMINAAITDAGIGGVTYAAKASTTLTLAKAAADITTPATTPLAASATNAIYCLLQYSQDALGNRSADPAACATNFGVDRAPPTIAYSGGIAANSRYAVAPGAEFTVTVNDTGLVGNSGMLPAAPVMGTVMFRGNGNTSAQTCFVGGWVSPTCSAVLLAGAAPTYGTTTMAATPGNTASTEGYYTFTATAYDAAGNSASLTSRTTLVDATAPTVGVATAPLSSTTYTFPVSALANENLDIQNYWFNANYAAATGPFTAPLTIAAGSVTAVNGYNAATFINTNYAVSTTFNLPVNIQANMGALASAVTGVSVSVMNQANTSTTGGASGVPVFGTAATAISLTNMTGFTVATLPTGITGVSSGVSTAATSSTLSVTTTGTTAIFNNPFARVDFYGLNVANTAWVFLGSTVASAGNDGGGVRTFTYSLPINGATAFAALGGTTATITPNVIAFGFKADGSVAMVNALAFPLNIVY